MDLSDKHDAAALMKWIENNNPSWGADGMKHLVWVLHDLTSSDTELPELSDAEVHDTLAPYPNDYCRIKDDELLNEVYDLRRKGVSYSAIARVIEDKPSGPSTISRETIRRYCNDAGVEAELD